MGTGILSSGAFNWYLWLLLRGKSAGDFSLPLTSIVPKFYNAWSLSFTTPICLHTVKFDLSTLTVFDITGIIKQCILSFPFKSITPVSLWVAVGMKWECMTCLRLWTTFSKQRVNRSCTTSDTQWAPQCSMSFYQNDHSTIARSGPCSASHLWHSPLIWQTRCGPSSWPEGSRRSLWVISTLTVSNN